ncbi:hypothetical protein LSH36_1703g00036 [Paralvinella palmiformis]|uniref:Uncharacterized protein n=1 Tax=Paralvinella palmiformis TaxID=53620 RepID=A0AAD9IRM1_9ANNE|nr:hypothetical protein LSH36_1703g00036 [Paralvinella palmiformis]
MVLKGSTSRHCYALTAMLQWRLSVDKMERCSCSVMCIRQDMIILHAHAHHHLSCSNSQAKN